MVKLTRCKLGQAKERELIRRPEGGRVNRDLAAEVAGMMYPYGDEVRERWEPQKLNSLHRKVLLLAFDAALNQVEIAKHLGVSKEMVNMVINSELGRQHLEYLHGQLDEAVLADVEKSITDIQPIAFEIQKQIMLNGADPLRLRAAQDFMDRGGTGVRQISSQETYGSKSRINEIKKLAEERRVVARKTTIEEVFLDNGQTKEKL